MTLLGVVDIHIWHGLAIQTGPGVEFIEDEELFVYRLGALYEFELGEGLTVSPQAHVDFTAPTDAVILWVAIGRTF